ncbi:MAG TPA: TIGR02300 family protein [Anaeromyxobacteraceae bacterium]|nr:TIGR02300 family protein [Anaeromyxobacteraceae bacterium]
MPAKDLGTKYLCFKCGTKFYDLKKSEPICPKCGADQRESPALKSPPASEKRRAPARPAPVPAPPPVPAEVDAEDAEPADEEDEAGEEDAPEDEDG